MDPLFSEEMDFPSFLSFPVLSLSQCQLGPLSQPLTQIQIHTQPQLQSQHHVLSQSHIQPLSLSHIQSQPLSHSQSQPLSLFHIQPQPPPQPPPPPQPHPQFQPLTVSHDNTPPLPQSPQPPPLPLQPQPKLMQPRPLCSLLSLSNPTHQLFQSQSAMSISPQNAAADAPAVSRKPRLMGIGITGSVRPNADATTVTKTYHPIARMGILPQTVTEIGFYCLVRNSQQPLLRIRSFSAERRGLCTHVSLTLPQCPFNMYDGFHAITQQWDKTQSFHTATLKYHFVQTLLGLSALSLRCIHRHGMLHRDIKPHNFMLTLLPDGQLDTVSVIDFGTVLREDMPKRSGVSTVVYCAPEACYLPTPQKTDPWADVYSYPSDVYALAASWISTLLTFIPDNHDQPFDWFGYLSLQHLRLVPYLLTQPQYQVIHAAVHANPDARPTLDQLIQVIVPGGYRHHLSPIQPLSFIDCPPFHIDDMMQRERHEIITHFITMTQAKQWHRRVLCNVLQHIDELQCPNSVTAPLSGLQLRRYACASLLLCCKYFQVRDAETCCVDIVGACLGRLIVDPAWNVDALFDDECLVWREHLRGSIERRPIRSEFLTCDDMTLVNYWMQHIL